ncbi:hypothetical protein M2150_001666 [Lachnospiraceae bacterium PM6-15]|uniref:PrgI family protein n=1 Tax=Ohessyouella blattaphilus TaxID=2949333 RepID=UPI003E2A036C
MNIRVNKDVTEYKNDLWKGLTLRQLVFGGVAVATAIGVVAGAYFLCYVPIDVAIYFGIPPAIIIALFGFIKVDDMTLYEYVQEIWRIKWQEGLCYESEDYTDAVEAEKSIYRICAESEKQQKKLEKKSKKRVKESRRKDGQ